MHKQHRRTRLMFSVALFVGFTLALAGCAGVESPVSESPIAEFNASTEAWAGDYVECLRDKGIDAEIHYADDGTFHGFQPAYGPDAELWEGILDLACIEAVGEPPEPPEPTTEFYEVYYDLSVEHAECLRDAGYVISDPPSKDEWVEGGGPPVWSPSSEIIAQESDVEGALQICPEPNGLQIEERMHELRDSQ